MKDAGSFSLILAITMSVSQWRQTPKKRSVYDKKKKKYFKHMLKAILLWRDSKQQPPSARKITLSLPPAERGAAAAAL